MSTLLSDHHPARPTTCMDTLAQHLLSRTHVPHPAWQETWVPTKGGSRLQRCLQCVRSGPSKADTEDSEHGQIRGQLMRAALKLRKSPDTGCNLANQASRPMHFLTGGNPGRRGPSCRPDVNSLKNNAWPREGKVRPGPDPLTYSHRPAVRAWNVFQETNSCWPFLNTWALH